MKNKMLNFALSLELYEKIIMEAKKNERTISAQLRYMITQYFEQKEQVKNKFR